MARRKPVNCLLCNEETYDPDKICDYCRNLWERGKLLKEQAESGEVEAISIANYWYLSHHWGKLNEDATARIKKAILALTDAHETALGFWELHSKVAIGSTGDRFQKPASTGYILKPGKKELLIELIQAIRGLSASEYQEGKSDGERFLSRLANNEISMNDLVSRDLKKK